MDASAYGSCAEGQPLPPFPPRKARDGGDGCSPAVIPGDHPRRNPARALLFAALALAGAAFANGHYPTKGVAADPAQPAAVTYDCVPGPDGEQIECVIVKTRLLPKAAAADLDARVAAARRDFARLGGRPFTPSECEMYRTLVTRLEDPQGVFAGSDLAALSARQRAEALAMGRLIVQACRSGAEADYLNVIRHRHERDTRTCQVNTETYRRALRAIGARHDSASTWVVKSSPSGECGLLELDRFEPDRFGGQTLWRFVDHDEVTNPAGSAAGGKPCGALVTAEHRYDWKAAMHPARCEYLEFSTR